MGKPQTNFQIFKKCLHLFTLFLTTRQAHSLNTQILFGYDHVNKKAHSMLAKTRANMFITPDFDRTPNKLPRLQVRVHTKSCQTLLFERFCYNKPYCRENHSSLPCASQQEFVQCIRITLVIFTISHYVIPTRNSVTIS